MLLSDSSGIFYGMKWPQAAHAWPASIHQAESERGVCHSEDTCEQPDFSSLLSLPAFSVLEGGRMEFGDRKFLLGWGAAMLMKGTSSRGHLSESKRNQSSANTASPQPFLCFPRCGGRKGMSGRRRGAGEMEENRRQDIAVHLFTWEVLK